MDEKQIRNLHRNSEDVYVASMSLEKDSKERDLLFYAAQLILIAVEIVEEKNNG